MSETPDPGVVGVGGRIGLDGGGASNALPGATERWRCGGCGNLTRFDVVRTATTREFWHVGLSGEPVIEETETLEQSVGTVVCRWCGRDDAISTEPRPGEPSQ